ncbi:MAG: alpha/beta hydrolase-fold protein [Chitinophagaceae bacterium]
MIKPTLSIAFLLFASSLTAQTSTRLEIRSLPAYHATGSSIYMAGSFNGWNPQDEQYKFKKDEKGNYFLEIKLDPGKYEYKITRGGWDKVECKKGGASIENRSLTIPPGVSVQLDIEEWADRIPAKPRVSTASKHVHVIDTAFLIPQLKRIRRVWIYLPENYAKGNRYPVLYMHDGQNVFDDATSFAGEWGVDEFLDSTKSQPCIVVAVDHAGDKRNNEYSPYDMERFGKGEGAAYVDFLVNTLKPYIDKNYRTRKDRENTFIAGSSMGGLISMYAILKYPKTFGGAGVFSPSFWIAPKIYDAIKENGEKIKGKIYFYAGKQEGGNMVTDLLKAFEKMSDVSKAGMTTVIRDGGKHTEATWRKEFPLFYSWLLPKK